MKSYLATVVLPLSLVMLATAPSSLAQESSTTQRRTDLNLWPVLVIDREPGGQSVHILGPLGEFTNENGKP